jgi:hypothetical protein
MKTYTVHFLSRKTGEIVHEVIVKSDNVNLVRLQAKLQALAEDKFRFDKRIHTLASPDF